MIWQRILMRVFSGGRVRACSDEPALYWGIADNEILDVFVTLPASFARDF